MLVPVYPACPFIYIVTTLDESVTFLTTAMWFQLLNVTVYVEPVVPCTPDAGAVP